MTYEEKRVEHAIVSVWCVGLPGYRRGHTNLKHYDGEFAGPVLKHNLDVLYSIDNGKVIVDDVYTRVIDLLITREPEAISDKIAYINIVLPDDFLTPPLLSKEFYRFWVNPKD